MFSFTDWEERVKNRGLICQASGAVIGSTGFLWQALSELCENVRACVDTREVCSCVFLFNMCVFALCVISYYLSVCLWCFVSVYIFVLTACVALFVD